MPRGRAVTAIGPNRSTCADVHADLQDVKNRFSSRAEGGVRELRLQSFTPHFG